MPYAVISIICKVLLTMPLVPKPPGQANPDHSPQALFISAPETSNDVSKEFDRNGESRPGHRRAPGKLKPVRIAFVAEIFDSDLAGEEPVGGKVT